MFNVCVWLKDERADHEQITFLLYLLKNPLMPQLPSCIAFILKIASPFHVTRQQYAFKCACKCVSFEIFVILCVSDIEI